MFFCFVLFCFPQRAALPATDSYKRNSERARVGGDHGVSSAKGNWCFPDAFIMSPLAFRHSLGGPCFLCGNIYGCTPAPPGNMKKFTFSCPYAKGLQEHNFQRQQVHCLEEREEKEGESPARQPRLGFSLPPAYTWAPPRPASPARLLTSQGLCSRLMRTVANASARLLTV